MKKRNRGFSFRAFSQKAGVSAPNFLQLLIQGKRNLSVNGIEKVCSAIGLASQEKEYFGHMVLFDQARENEKKAHHFKILAQMRKPYTADTLTEEQFELYRCWYYKPLRELLAFHPLYPGEQYAYRHLASKLLPSISESEARAAIKQMLKLGLLKKDKNGRVVQTSRFITTGDEVQSFLVRQFHESMITLAQKAQDRIDPSQRDVSSLTVSISCDGFSRIKQEIQLFRKRLLEIVKQDSDPENVYQINFQLFPVTDTKKGKSEGCGKGA
ncbi:hypothetical protein CHISP_3306 [Chitinispirillum alkaliphilum]|nr:hypothetical protein CHISP_3306 [Chitinispirillum alkaliphilum]